MTIRCYVHQLYESNHRVTLNTEVNGIIAVGVLPHGHSCIKKIEKFFANYRLRHFAKSQILIYAGEDPPSIFHLISGQVRQYDITEKGEEVVVNVFKPPAFFLMAWAINKTPNQYFFETSEPTELRMAPASDVVAFLKANHDVTYDLLSRLYTGTNY